MEAHGGCDEPIRAASRPEKQTPRKRKLYPEVSRFDPEALPPSHDHVNGLVTSSCDDQIIETEDDPMFASIDCPNCRLGNMMGLKVAAFASAMMMVVMAFN